jgi:hypothetical protein
VSSACIMFQTWALEKKGPVMVSMFSPTQTVDSAIFSALFLGRVMQPGRYIILEEPIDSSILIWLALVELSLTSLLLPTVL